MVDLPRESSRFDLPEDLHAWPHVKTPLNFLMAWKRENGDRPSAERRDSSSAVVMMQRRRSKLSTLSSRPLVVVKAVDLQSRRLRLQTGLLNYFGFHLSDFTICYFSLGFGCIFVLCADHAIYSARRSPASPGVWCSSRIPGNLGEQRLRLTLAATLPTNIYSCVEIMAQTSGPKAKRSFASADDLDDDWWQGLACLCVDLEYLPSCIQ